MYAITGITGHVGSATAAELIARGAPVRAVLRDPAKGAAWERRGAEVALADLGDRDALGRALRGSRAAFIMLPVIPGGGEAEHHRMADAIAGAVADSGVARVVMLSSIGAELPEGTGPIRWLHHLETGLRGTGATVTAIRSGHFQEKVEEVLGAALGAGVYPVFGDRADVPVPMVATRDIGALAARELLVRPAAGEVIDLEGPEYTEQQVADHLAAVLGRPLGVVTIPQAGWVGALTEAGVPESLARELAQMYDAGWRGVLRPCGDRLHRGTTPIEETLRRVVDAASAATTA